VERTVVNQSEERRAMNPRFIPFLGLLGLLLLTGCAAAEHSMTHKLWDTGEFSRFSEPAAHPNLALFATADQRDVLVEYDAWSERHSRITRRAYFLGANTNRIARGEKPEFVAIMTASGMTEIPVFTRAVLSTNPPPADTMFAVTEDSRGFTLHCPTAPDATFDLPVYGESSGTAKRLALTPLAVAGDATVVAGAAAVIGFLMWVQAGAPTGCDH
jgi:hypothetical protein